MTDRRTTFSDAAPPPDRADRDRGASIRAGLVLAASVAFALAPFLTPEFGGFDPTLYPVPQVDPPAQPAGWAFSIWGVIYLWLIASAAYGLARRAADAAWDRTRIPLLIALVVGAAWLSVALVSPIWATLLIITMCLSALAAVRRAPPSDAGWLRLPLGLFAGWLTAASLVSVALLGAGYGMGSGLLWGVVAVVAASVAGVGVQAALPATPTFGIAVAWALTAVAAQNLASLPLLSVAAGAGAAAVLWSAWRARARTGSVAD